MNRIKNKIYSLIFHGLKSNLITSKPFPNKALVYKRIYKKDIDRTIKLAQKITKEIVIITDQLYKNPKVKIINSLEDHKQLPKAELVIWASQNVDKGLPLLRSPYY